jgi:hypothetical protein
MTDSEYVMMEKSTIVRSRHEPSLMPLVRAGTRTLSALAPALAARLAERLFLTPPRPRPPAAEIALLASARARPLHAGARRIEVWTWGSGPSVLLVHGWGGRGAQLGALVEPLVARGFSVVTFDAPGHGAADGGEVTIPEMAAAIREVAAASGPLAGLIAHSMGAACATLALSGASRSAPSCSWAPRRTWSTRPRGSRSIWDSRARSARRCAGGSSGAWAGRGQPST